MDTNFVPNFFWPPYFLISEFLVRDTARTRVLPCPCHPLVAAPKMCRVAAAASVVRRLAGITNGNHANNKDWEDGDRADYIGL